MLSKATARAHPRLAPLGSLGNVSSGLSVVNLPRWGLDGGLSTRRHAPLVTINRSLSVLPTRRVSAATRPRLYTPTACRLEIFDPRGKIIAAVYHDAHEKEDPGRFSREKTTTRL